MAAPWGVVLAGGPGKRMGGDKPLKEIAGRRLIDRALDTLDKVCQQTMVVTVDIAGLADLQVPVIRDRWPGKGPLNAITTAFLDSEAESIVVMAVDLPLVEPKLLELVAFGPEDDKARAPMGLKGPQPLLAYYHRLCLPAAMRQLEKGELRIRFLLKAVGASYIPLEEVHKVDPEELSFLNVNYPEDLEKAYKIGRERGLFDT
jgi:molybdopterin-guanine dinucleotide biosynthesis protein A